MMLIGSEREVALWHISAVYKLTIIARIDHIEQKEQEQQ